MSVDDSHLGPRLAPLVDGELDHAERERSLSHLAGCTDCRAEAEAQRRVKARLAGLGAPPQAPGLTARLMELARAEALAQGAGPDAVRGVPGVAAFAPAPTLPMASFVAPRPVGARPSPAGPSRTGRRRRSVRWAAGSGSVALLGLGAALVLGAPNDRITVVDPSQARFVVDHVATSTEVPFSTPPVGAAVTATYRR